MLETMPYPGGVPPPGPPALSWGAHALKTPRGKVGALFWRAPVPPRPPKKNPDDKGAPYQTKIRIERMARTCCVLEASIFVLIPRTALPPQKKQNLG